MAKKISLLAVQIGSVIADKKKNIEKVENLLRDELSNEKSDFVFLPEVWTSGWDCPTFSECAEDILGADSVCMLKNVAKAFGVNIICGSFI